MNVLFDLDGTLTDPFLGITGCIQHALTTLGRQAPSRDDLRWCIGPPLQQSLATLLGSADEALAERALGEYRSRFASVGLFENEVYPGIEHTLGQLKTSGHRLFVATSKPTVYAVRILDHFKLTPLFSGVYGSELSGVRSDKAELIAYVLEQEGIRSRDTAMVGDREHDMIGARHNRVAGIGVLWGYGSRPELDSAGAAVCLESPEALESAIQEVCRRNGDDES